MKYERERTSPPGFPLNPQTPSNQNQSTPTHIYTEEIQRNQEEPAKRKKKPTQNIYDTPAFFDAYASLPRQVDGLSSAPEWPALRRLLPGDLRGKHVLDLGCGFGWYSRWFVGQDGAGAASARGVDISERMLARAREMTPTGDNGTRITFDRADLEDIQLPAGAYDLVSSALALHYVSDLRRLLGQVHSLRPGGSLVFSVEHPLVVWITHISRVAVIR